MISKPMGIFEDNQRVDVLYDSKRFRIGDALSDIRYHLMRIAWTSSTRARRQRDRSRNCKYKTRRRPTMSLLVVQLVRALSKTLLRDFSNVTGRHDDNRWRKEIRTTRKRTRIYTHDKALSSLRMIDSSSDVGPTQGSSDIDLLFQLYCTQDAKPTDGD